MTENHKNLPALDTPEELLELASPPEHELLAPVHEELLTAPQQPTDEGLTAPPATTMSTVVSGVDNDHLEDDVHLFDRVGSDVGVEQANTENSIIPTMEKKTPFTQEVSPVQDSLPDASSEVSESDLTQTPAPETIAPAVSPVQETPPPTVVAPLVSEPIIHEETSHGIKKNHKTLWMTLGALAFFVLVGVALWWFVFGGNTGKAGSYAYTVTPDKQMNTYIDEVVLRQQEYEKNINTLNQAMAEKNTAYCETITDVASKLECQESVKALILSASGTIAECQVLTLTGVRDRCISSVAQTEAISKENKELCANIIDATQAQACRDAVDAKVLAGLIESKSITREACQTLDATTQKTCLSSIVEQDDTAIMASAISSDSLEACQKLSTDDLQYVCFDAILIKRALTNGDKASCDLIHDADKKSTCLTQVGARDDNAIFKSAITEKNLQTCTPIQNPTLRDRCHDAVTLLIVRDTRDATLCDTLISTGTVDACKKSAAQ